MGGLIQVINGFDRIDSGGFNGGEEAWNETDQEGEKDAQHHSRPR